MLPTSVQIREVGPRDGFQNEPEVLPTAVKVALIESLARQGAGVVVATHDVEFASEFAERVGLLGEGVVIADGRMEDVLSGGWYFATEVARVLDLPGVVTPEQGAVALAEGCGAFLPHSDIKATHPEGRAG